MADAPGQTENVTPLEQLIRDRIRDHGAMPVSDYMALVILQLLDLKFVFQFHVYFG